MAERSKNFTMGGAKHYVRIGKSFHHFSEHGLNGRIDLLDDGEVYLVIEGSSIRYVSRA